MSQTPKGWGKLTVADLKEELQKRGLPTSGLKKDLVDRLSVHDGEGEGRESVKKEIKENIGEEPITNGDGNSKVEPLEKSDKNIKKEIKEEDDAADQDESIEKEFDEIKDEDEDDVLDLEEGDNKDALSEGNEEEENEFEEFVEFDEGDSEIPMDENQEEVTESEEHKEGETKDEKVEDEAKGVEISEKELKDTDKADDEGPITGQEKGENQSFSLQEGCGDMIVLDELDDVEESKVQKGKRVKSESGQPENKDKEKKVEQKEKDDKEDTAKEPKKATLRPPMAFSLFSRFIEQQMIFAQKERTWQVKSLKPREAVFTTLIECARKACDFSITYSADPLKGFATLKYLTKFDSNKARSALSKAFGNENVVHHIGNREDDRSLQSSDLASRSIVVQGIPNGTKEDDVCIYFPGSKFISCPQKRSGEMKVTLPDDIENIFLIQFADKETALSAIKHSQNIKSKFEKASVKELRKYVSDYKLWEYKQRSELEKKKMEEAMKRVFSDSERIEMCKALKGINVKLCQFKPGEEQETKDKLRQQMVDVRKAIDADTEERVALNLKFPEPEKLMTIKTRSAQESRERKMRIEDKRKRESGRTRERSQKESFESTRESARTPDGPEKSPKIPEPVQVQLNNLHQDQKGFYTVSVLKVHNMNTVLDLKRTFSKFGTIRDWNFTTKRAYVRFGTKKEAETVVKYFGRFPRWQVMVPTTDKLYTEEHGVRELESGDSEGVQEPPRTRKLSTGAETPITAKRVKADVELVDPKQADVPSGQKGEPLSTPKREASAPKEAEKSTTSPQQESTSSKPASSKPAKVYVSNVKKLVSIAMLKTIFGEFGRVLSIHMEQYQPLVETTNAVVIYADATSAFQALSADDVWLKGFKLGISATPDPKKPESKKTDIKRGERLERPEKEDVPVDRSIFVRSLTLETDETMLMGYFSNVGQVEKARIFRETVSKRSRGFGLLIFTNPSSVEKALAVVSHVIDGKVVTVQRHKDSPERKSRLQKSSATKSEDFQSRQRGGRHSSADRNEPFPPRMEPGIVVDYGFNQSVPSLMSNPVPQLGHTNPEHNRDPRMLGDDFGVNEEWDRGGYRDMADPTAATEYYDRVDRFRQDERDAGKQHYGGREHGARDHSSREFDRYGEQSMNRKYEDSGRYEQQQHRGSGGVESERRGGGPERNRYEEDRYASRKQEHRDRGREVDRQYHDDKANEKYFLDRKPSGKPREPEKGKRKPSNYDNNEQVSRQRGAREEYERDHTERRDRSRPDPHEQGPTKRRRQNEAPNSRSKSPFMESDAVANVLKSIGDVISSKMSELGKSEEPSPSNPPSSTGGLYTSYAGSMPSVYGAASAAVAPQQAAVVPAAAPQVIQQQQVLQQQQMLQQQALQQQQQVLQQRQQQLLLHKQQEEQLQRELMELQKMKEAALREAHGH